MMTKKEQRLRRARQTRIRIAQQGVARLTVNRTNLHIYASVISGCGTKSFGCCIDRRSRSSHRIGCSWQRRQRCRSCSDRQAHC